MEFYGKSFLIKKLIPVVAEIKSSSRPRYTFVVLIYERSYLVFSLYYFKKRSNSNKNTLKDSKTTCYCFTAFAITCCFCLMKSCITFFKFEKILRVSCIYLASNNINLQSIHKSFFGQYRK